MRLAARVCRNVQAKITPDVMQKDDRSPVTVADFASQAVICRAIGRCLSERSDHRRGGIGDAPAGRKRSVSRPRSERAARDRHRDVRQEACDWIDRGCEKSYVPRFWTLDPIDGTKGFLRKEQYAISLASLDRRKDRGGPARAVRICTCEAGGTLRRELCSTRSAGAGSWALPLDGDGPPRRVHDEPCVRCHGRPDFASRSNRATRPKDFRPRWPRCSGIDREPLRIDSQAKYAVVARGEAEIYLRLPAKFGYKEKIWDHAGGVLVVEEAGGPISRRDGQAARIQSRLRALGQPRRRRRQSSSCIRA